MLSNNNYLAGALIGDLGKGERGRNCRSELQSPEVTDGNSL